MKKFILWLLKKLFKEVKVKTIDVKKVIADLDKNNDGYIDLGELVEIFKIKV